MFGSRAEKAAEWDRLDDRFRMPLRSYFTRRVRNRGDAEDLTQEVFLRLARHPDRNRGETIAAYVFKIASCVLLDWRRQQMSHRSAAHQAWHEGPLPGALVESLTPERVVAAKQSLRDIEAGLSELSDRTREIFILSRIENIQHREIAQLHGISVSAVEKHVLKAASHLSAGLFER